MVVRCSLIVAKDCATSMLQSNVQRRHMFHGPNLGLCRVAFSPIL